MGRPKKTSILSEFERTRDPDVKLLGDLTSRSRGRRTVTEFAGQCGVNASTMSRIINGKISSPISDELLVAIAANADPDSGVTFKDLLSAHGIAMKDAGESDVDYESLLRQKMAELSINTGAMGLTTFSGRGASQLEQNAREIIQNDLLNKGFNVSVERGVDLLEGVMFPYIADFVIVTEAVEGDGLQKWAFDVISNPSRNIIAHLDRIFASAYLDSPSAKGIKMSIVTFDRPTFYKLMDELQGRRIPDCISAMLLDARDRSVQYEYIADRVGHPEQVRLYPDGGEIDPQEIYGVPDDDE